MCRTDEIEKPVDVNGIYEDMKTTMIRVLTNNNPKPP
jgi:hypothetical protein